jgi:hypothetical protein
VKPGGNRVVMPVILPVFTPLRLELIKFVALFIVTPVIIALFRLQSVNTLDDRFTPDRSSSDMSTDEYVVLLPTIMIVIILFWVIAVKLEV